MAFNLPSVEKLKNIRVGRILIIGSTEVIINSDVGETKTAQHQLRCVIISIGEDARECCWNGQQKGLKWDVISELCDEVGTQFPQFHQTYILLDGI